jgi:hypothetical protein
MYQTSLFRRHAVYKQANINPLASVEKRCTQIWNIVSYNGAIYNMSRRQQLELSTECVLYSYEVQHITSPSSYDEIRELISRLNIDNDIETTTCCF